jgi:FimV-like protein
MQLPTVIQQFYNLITQPLQPFADYISAHPMAQWGLIGMIIALMLLLLYIARDRPHQSVAFAAHTDINTIAGGDTASTQLDLARAYIEMGQTKMAKNILNAVVKTGNSQQKKAALRLMQSCK